MSATLIFFLCLFAAAIGTMLVVYRLITKGPDFKKLEISSVPEDLIKILVKEINTALSLNQTELIHKFNCAEPPIDGEVVNDVAEILNDKYKIAFYHESNGDVRIELRRYE